MNLFTSSFLQPQEEDEEGKHSSLTRELLSQINNNNNYNNNNNNNNKDSNLQHLIEEDIFLSPYTFNNQYLQPSISSPSSISDLTTTPSSLIYYNQTPSTSLYTNSLFHMADSPDNILPSTVSQQYEMSPNNSSFTNNVLIKSKKPSFNHSISSGSNSTPPTSLSSSSASNINSQLMGKKSKRRRHKNSKLGCSTCKERRVKCSEDLPSCINCIKHKVKCPYLDYTEDQLEELRQAKILLQQQQQSDSEDEITNLPIISNSSNKLPLRKIAKPKTKRARSFPQPNKQALFNEHEDTQMNYSSSNSIISSSNSSSYSNLVNKAQPVTQNFDNLLNNQFIQHHQQQQQQQQQQHQPQPHQVQTQTQLTHPQPPIQNEPLSNDHDFSIVYPVYSFSSREVSVTPFHTNNNNNCLQNAVSLSATFSYTPSKSMDYENILKDTVKQIGPSIRQGTTSLPVIRNLFKTWLNSFIYKAYTKDIMFYCLLNLTTNFLISNCFRDSRKLLLSNKEVENEDIDEDMNVDKASSDKIKLLHIRNECTQQSLKYYSHVIQSLRNILNNNSDPDLSGSVSYILSLMSIYDPEATLNSTICFRNGLFSIFNHNYNAIKKSLDPKTLILLPAHQKLMLNIAMSVYLPSYDPTFLSEYQTLLIRFGELVFPLLQHYKSTNTSDQTNNHNNFAFLQTNYNHLLNFTNDTLNYYLPQLTENLSNLELQQSLLFEMVYKWVRIFPTKLIKINKKNDPLEKVLYLFFKVFKKSLFAIFPQIKFFFLRDFDSPLMLDLFDSSQDDYNIFHEELENPINNNLPPEFYEPIINELKTISGYLIRIITFLQIRLNYLYKVLVYDSNAIEVFKIDDVLQWGKRTTDIKKARSDFKELSGLNEVFITSFIHQTIKCENYPKEVKPQQQKEEDSNGSDENVDFMTLLPSGLLINDFDLRDHLQPPAALPLPPQQPLKQQQ
ncbi:putative fungal zinc cluster transcription factor [Candida maltosa Xu316]|uniref:Putative fungal zinc cluster transcription factor n=1 Tax=Candida maltosa (strain Xu316) TaxID=1245528 RepID=M3HRG0_CANMX|nr:putative fungal zinc cluster transcription factor [Candida maltosa Xu316]